MQPVSEITHGIKVSVIPKYHHETSKPSLGRYIHSYDIAIENLSGLEVQLLRRHWIITDGFGNSRVIKGDGVIGQQPILGPDDVHYYTSWSPMTTPVGKMKGFYTMRRTADNSFFEVEIPEFPLIAELKLN